MMLQVLSDSARRTQYDAARSTLHSGPRAAAGNGGGGGGGPCGAATQSEDAFEAAFKKWWERAGAQWAPVPRPFPDLPCYFLHLPQPAWLPGCLSALHRFAALLP